MSNLISDDWGMNIIIVITYYSDNTMERFEVSWDVYGLFKGIWQEIEVILGKSVFVFTFFFI